MVCVIVVPRREKEYENACFIFFLIVIHPSPIPYRAGKQAYVG